MIILKSDQPETNSKAFIFDENLLVKQKVFSSHKLNDDIFGVGIFLARNEMQYIGKGNSKMPIGEKQVWKPVIVTSNNSYHEYTYSSALNSHIDYEIIPSKTSLRWSLKSIEDWVNNRIKIINISDLFNSIKNQYNKFCYFREEEWYDINCLWDLGTYFHQLFSAFPIKEERGFQGTGKTKCMIVSSKISLNATDIMLNPSASTLFRLTNEIRPTKYVDEAEKLFRFTNYGLETDERVELLNASYISNGKVPRQEKFGNGYKTMWYNVYSPTRISSINGLYGPTESRAITQFHVKAPDNDERGEIDPEQFKEHIIWQEIRDNCYIWTLQNWKLVESEYNNFDINTNLKKRDLQLWKPILILAKIIDKEELLSKIIKFAEKISELRNQEYFSVESLEYKILEIYHTILDKNKLTKTYLQEIKNWFNANKSEDNKPVREKTISTILDKLGFIEFKRRDKEGVYYELSLETFERIVLPYTNVFAKEIILKKCRVCSKDTNPNDFFDGACSSCKKLEKEGCDFTKPEEVNMFNKN